MPPRKKGEGALPPASGSGGGINALPDGVIQHILGFLDAKEAVRTCVLARPWRHLWRSASSLRVKSRHNSLAEVSTFLEHVLLLRAGSPLDTFELNFDAYDYEDRDVQRVHFWVRYALLCKARVLNLRGYSHINFPLDDLPLVSQHMRILKLFGVLLLNRTFDFLSCPSLEYLHMTYCSLSCVRKISSKSLKHLSFRNCNFDDQRFRTHIYAPSLVSLKLDDPRYLHFSFSRTPVLDRMPLLKNAFVRLTRVNADSCTHADSGNCGHDNCNACYGIEDENSSGCVLLEGLSKAEDLSLIAESKTFIFKRDLKQCPTFSNLRTLLLNDYWDLNLSLELKEAGIHQRVQLQYRAT